MQKIRYKKKRPNLESANQYLKDGIYGYGGFFTPPEREAEIRAVVEELDGLAKQFPRTQNLEYAVLKCHLIIERVITLYIQCHSKVHIDVETLRFTFKQKLDIAYLMGLGANDPVLLPFFDLLNKARNQVAHTFILSVKTVDDAIRLASRGNDDFNPKTDRQRVSALRTLCGWYCGMVGGLIEGEFYVLFGDELFPDECS